ncbi:PTS lactose/cellobiose transporter subunit IIA [Xylocopilactobacillus apicola]|uniref:PTS system lactose-specific EIIA component n=1 Tax=Xylocopilactobacillus apicola TaxID=2932184 RepID=A0AAU9CYU4_9LACO|nr:PTS lactose/cellobiose transporter subunit IIA [Xylocopilactobacillus apicola]BDR57591.1 PTS system lactose-specific EIIA component [Xylocopilactobacillus apicola]
MSEIPPTGENTKIQDLAMEIIAFAGDGHAESLRAIDEEFAENSVESINLLEKAHGNIERAHKAQTKLLQMEAKGEEITPSLLMVHAQNHLMNSILINELSEKMIQMYRKLKEREV